MKPFGCRRGSLMLNPLMAAPARVRHDFAVDSGPGVANEKAQPAHQTATSTGTWLVSNPLAATRTPK